MSETVHYVFGPNEAPPKVDVVSVDLWYPRIEGNCHTVEVGLCDVRAADDIRLTYDFERDGWTISQKSGVEHDGWFEWDGAWVEVAFIKAWQLARPKRKKENPPSTA